MIFRRKITEEILRDFSSRVARPLEYFSFNDLKDLGCKNIGFVHIFKILLKNILLKRENLKKSGKRIFRSMDKNRQKWLFLSHAYRSPWHLLLR